MLTKEPKLKKSGDPKLRFSGFSDPWREIKLGEIATFSKGKGISKDDVTEDGEHKCIRYGELYTHYKEIIREVHSKTNVSPADSFVSKKDDVIIPASGETALDIATTSCVKDAGILLGGDINVLRFKDHWSGDYFAYYLKNFKKKDIARLAQGQSVVHLYPSQLRELKLLVPSFAEQQKLASFLESIDNWSNSLRAQRDSLETYKKGIAQRIFSKQIRFKDDFGKNYPDWEKKKLGSFLTERDERSPKSERYPLMAFVAYKGVIPKGERYNREFLVSDSSGKDYKRTEYGDFIYSSNNLETGSIGLNRHGSASISPVYSIFTVDSSCDYEFINSYFTRKNFVNKMIRFRQGVVYGQWRIHESDFLKIEEEIPCIDEQKKIADYLGSIDEILQTKERQIVYASQWKKALMQKLFI
jgi:type I restriction enzyme S subunit